MFLKRHTEPIWDKTEWQSNRIGPISTPLLFLITVSGLKPRLLCEITLEDVINTQAQAHLRDADLTNPGRHSAFFKVMQTLGDLD